MNIYMVKDKKTGLYLRKPIKHFLGLPIPDFSTEDKAQIFMSKAEAQGVATALRESEVVFRTKNEGIKK